MKRIKTIPIKAKVKPKVKSLTEQIVSFTFGPDAVVGQGRILVCGGRFADKENTIVKHIVGGVVLAKEDWCGDDKEWQCWDCDVVLIPKKKLAKNTAFKGATLDRYLTEDGLILGWTQEIYPTKRSLE